MLLKARSYSAEHPARPFLYLVMGAIFCFMLFQVAVVPPGYLGKDPAHWVSGLILLSTFSATMVCLCRGLFLFNAVRGRAIITVIALLAIYRVYDVLFTGTYFKSLMGTKIYYWASEYDFITAGSCWSWIQ